MTRKNLHRLLVLSTKIRHTKVLSLWFYLHIVQNQSKLIYELEVSIEIIPLVSYGSDWKGTRGHFWNSGLVQEKSMNSTLTIHAFFFFWRYYRSGSRLLQYSKHWKKKCITWFFFGFSVHVKLILKSIKCAIELCLEKQCIYLNLKTIYC